MDGIGGQTNFNIFLPALNGRGHTPGRGLTRIKEIIGMGGKEKPMKLKKPGGF